MLLKCCKIYNMKYAFNFNDLDTLRVINQDHVTQYTYPSPSKYNAIWDSILHPNGKVYFALCTELTTSAYTKLVEYDPDTNQVKDIFDAEAMILPSDRFIRDSKLHTSLSIMEDGCLIMATHTTDKAPNHPAWMPFSNYSNPWEGFAGSSILTYNPHTNVTENHGILVPRETLYGGMYDPKKRMYYALGFMKGHLYRYHLDTRKVEDLGKQVEKASYRMVMGPDDNIYFTTRNGRIKRINTDNLKVELLPHTLPNASDKGYNHAYLTSAVSYDNKFYLSGMHHDELSVYVPKTDAFETVGRYVNFDLMIKEYQTTKYIGSIIFDKNGTLWYVVCGARLDNNEDFITASILMKWDLVNAPVEMGIVGTSSRASVRTCGIHYKQKSDTLVIVGTNHANDGVEITCVNIDKLSEAKGPICKDPLIYPNNGLYDTYGNSIVEHWKIVDDNPFHNKYLYSPLALWKDFKQDEIIEKIAYLPNLIIKTNYECYELVDHSLKKTVKQIKVETHSIESDNLPYYNGRQYRAQVDKAIQFDDGTYFVATYDGMFALLSQDSVFSLGALGVFAPVRDMILVDEDLVVGIIGDKDDIAQIFRFHRTKGLKVLGMAAYEDSLHGCNHSTSLGSLAYDPLTENLAFASDDAMPTLYFMKKGDIQ